jgi:hypothetical protein
MTSADLDVARVGRVTARKAIPLPVARRLRQESGFGCCKCGLPIIEYHHIQPYTSADPHFRPEDMMVLCPTHHHEATVSAMLEAEQRQLKVKPFNIVAGYVEGMLKVNQNFAAFSMGSVQVVGDGTFVKVDESNLLALSLDDAGRLQLSIELYDKDDNLLGLIERNEWISGDPLPWDIIASFQKLDIRRKRGSVVLSIDARSEPLKITGDLWRSGQNVRLSEDGVTLDGVAAGGISVSELCLVGMGIKVDTAASCMELVPHERFGMVFVSWPDVGERLRRGRVAWLELTLGVSFKNIGRNEPCPCNGGLKFKRCHLRQVR